MEQLAFEIHMLMIECAAAYEQIERARANGDTALVIIGMKWQRRAHIKMRRLRDFYLREAA